MLRPANDPPPRPDVTADSVTITVPVDGYEKVVRLVSAGLASRLGFGFETVDDLQLAIELVLRSMPVARRLGDRPDDERRPRR